MQKQSLTDTRTTYSVADEAEMYASSFPGLDVEVVRIGHGDGPNVTRRTEFEDIALATGSIGFPMLGKANIGENTVLINLITSAPPGSRWCGIDLEPGTLMLYAPGALHTGVSPVGLRFSFVATNV